MKHTCLRKIKYMLQDFVVETSDAAAADDEDDDDENDDDDYESCGSLPLFSIFLCCNDIVPQRRKKFKNNNLKILNIENMYTIINKFNFVFHTAYESTNHCKNR